DHWDRVGWHRSGASECPHLAHQHGDGTGQTGRYELGWRLSVPKRGSWTLQTRSIGSWIREVHEDGHRRPRGPDPSRGHRPKSWGTEQTVNVEADALQVQSASNEISSLITGQQVTQLATNGRNV